MKRLYFIGQGGASWRDPRNWSHTPGGEPVRHLHARGCEKFVIRNVEGHDRLDLRGLPHAAVEVVGYQGRLRMPDGSRVHFQRQTIIGRLRARLLRSRLAPRIPNAISGPVAKAGGWQRAVRDGLAALISTPGGWVVVPLLGGGAVALVANGTVVSNGGSGAVAPAFGGTTVAGHLLLCTVIATTDSAGGNFTCSSGSWSRAVQEVGIANVQSAIFYKANCVAGETAPTFSYSLAATLNAALWEFSGVATLSPLDQSAGANGSGSISSSAQANPICGAADGFSGSLIVTSDAWTFSSGTTSTSTDTYGNGATPTVKLNNDASATVNHYRFAYGVTTTKAAADSNLFDNGKVGAASKASSCIASFKPARLVTDTGVTVSDSIVPLTTRGVSDTGLTVTATLPAKVIRVVTDTGVAVSDSLAKAVPRPVSDTGLTVSDSIATARVHAISVTGVTVSDSLARTASRPITDNGLTVSDSIAATTLRAVAITDTGLTVSDSPAKAAVKFLSDQGVAVSDAINSQPIRLVLIADTGATVSDSTATRRLRLIADIGATVGDSTGSEHAVFRAITDTGLSVSDSIGSRPTRVVAITTTGLTVSDFFAGLVRTVAITTTGLTIRDSLHVRDIPGFSVGTDVPAFASASAVVVAYGSTITDQPGGLP